jgi:hypothetical protein
MSLTKRWMEENCDWDREFQYEDYYDDDYDNYSKQDFENWKKYTPTDWGKYEPIQKNYPIFDK